jgi:cob(I)alamin adenosyltransferase
MSLYAKTGGRHSQHTLGNTSTLGGQKVSKNDILIHFIGAADEFNSYLGLIKAMLSNHSAQQFIEEIQKNLMKIMSHVSDTANDKYIFPEDEVNNLEKEIDRLSEKLPQKFQFVLPGYNVVEAQIHIARTIARKAERLFFAVNEKQPLCSNAGVYLNRLSDYLFALAQQECQAS